MSLFNNILKELSEKIKGGELYKENISKEISNIIGINITPDQIKIKQGKLVLLISPTIKTMVFLKKEIILNNLKKYKINTIG